VLALNAALLGPASPFWPPGPVGPAALASPAARVVPFGRGWPSRAFTTVGLICLVEVTRWCLAANAPPLTDRTSASVARVLPGGAAPAPRIGVTAG